MPVCGKSRLYVVRSQVSQLLLGHLLSKVALTALHLFGLKLAKRVQLPNWSGLGWGRKRSMVVG